MGELIMFTNGSISRLSMAKKKKDGLDIGDRFPDIVAYERW